MRWSDLCRRIRGPGDQREKGSKVFCCSKLNQVICALGCWPHAWRSLRDEGHRCPMDHSFGSSLAFVCLYMQTLSFNEISAIRNPFRLWEHLRSLGIFLSPLLWPLSAYWILGVAWDNSQLTVNNDAHLPPAWVNYGGFWEKSSKMSLKGLLWTGKRKKGRGLEHSGNLIMKTRECYFFNPPPKNINWQSIAIFTWIHTIIWLFYLDSVENINEAHGGFQTLAQGREQGHESKQKEEEALKPKEKKKRENERENERERFKPFAKLMQNI